MAGLPRSPRLVAGLVGILVTVAPPGHFATLRRTCAPFDGAAIILFITDQPQSDDFPEPPYRSITVYRGLEQVLGKRFQLDSSTQQLGSSLICEAQNQCRPARAATVSFGRLDRDNSTEVDYRLELAGQAPVSGRARARFMGNQMRCG